MDLSHQLAQIIGALFVVVGIGLILNGSYYRQMLAQFLKNDGLYYFSGALAFVIGMAMVLNHNIWTSDWRSLVTVIGWLSLFKGTMRLVFPQAGFRLASAIMSSTWLTVLGALVLFAAGGVLAVNGFEMGG